MLQFVRGKALVYVAVMSCIALWITLVPFVSTMTAEEEWINHRKSVPTMPRKCRAEVRQFQIGLRSSETSKSNGKQLMFPSRRVSVLLLINSEGMSRRHI